MAYWAEGSGRSCCPTSPCKIPADEGEKQSATRRGFCQDKYQPLPKAVLELGVAQGEGG